MTREVRILAEGMAFPEGPAFDPNGVLHVCELGNRRVSRIVDGKVEVVADMGGSPNGLAYAADGIGYVCNGGGRWAPETSTGGKFGNGDSPSYLQRLYPDGRFDTLIAEIDGTLINSPNDLVFDDHGGIYFTDPVWPDFTNLEAREQNPNGWVCYTDVDGNAVRVTNEVRSPNGLGVTADGKTLYVCCSMAGAVSAFDIDAPGKVSNGRTHAVLDARFVADGMAIDSEGYILVAGHGSGYVWVYPPEGGEEPIEKIDAGDKDVTNVCFGGPDYSTLFITQSDSGRIGMIEWDRPGMVLHPFA